MIGAARGCGLLAVVLSLLAGCTNTPKPEARELPPTGSIVEAHDGRVAALGSFWARASVRVEGRDAVGSRFSEQGEGHVQSERAGRVAITLGKLGEVYFALGSNEDRYWLIDVSDSSRRVIVSGEQSSVTPEKAAALGLPVHPRDIPLLLGLNPIGDAIIGDPSFNDRGQIVVQIEARWGRAEFRFQPGTLDLIGTAAYDADGTLLADATLSRHIGVGNEVGQGTLGRVPGKAEIRVPGFDGFVRMVLEDPRVRPINPTAFDPERLRRAYRVREAIDLDQPIPGNPG